MFKRLFNKKPKIPLLFVHVPKAAGSSFRTSLDVAFGCNRVCVDYRGGSGFISPEVQCFMIEQNNPNLFRAAFDKKGYWALSGHYQARRYAGIFEPSSYVAFVRRPVDYLNSVYRRRLRHKLTSESFEEFIENPKFHNRQSYFLQGVPWPTFGCVGVSERFSDSLRVINHHFELNLKEQHSNVDKAYLNTENGRRKPDDDKLSQYEARVNELNQQDVALYEQANRCLDERLSMIERSGVLVRGGVTCADSNSLRLSLATYDLPQGNAQLQIGSGSGDKQSFPLDIPRSKAGLFEMNVVLPHSFDDRTNCSIVIDGGSYPLQHWVG